MELVADEYRRAEEELADLVASLAYRPDRYVDIVYPWGEGELEGELGPRQWQRTALERLRRHLEDKKTRHTPFRMAVSSGHGIGKTALLAWIVSWALDTMEDTKVVITADTDTQARTKIKPEIDKWFRFSLTSYWWDVQTTSIKSRALGHEATWRMDMVPWSASNPQAFAGLHNKGKRIVVIFDEASEIDDSIWEVVEGATTDEGTEILWIVFSQPTQNTGRFKECFEKFRHRWIGEQIDSRDVEGINKALMDEWVTDWGDDSDFVRIRVKGQFPRASWNQFISGEDIDNCLKYKAEGYKHLPKIGSCDVARFGDDQSVIGDRQGRKSRIWKKFRGLDTAQLARHCMDYIDTEKPDAFVVDGDGIGGGVIDTLKDHRYHKKTTLIEFHGGMPAQDQHMYFNRRAEVWGLMREAVRSLMEIPNDRELKSDLGNPKYGFSNKQQIQLERKQDMKARKLPSPDCGDMLAMTFGIKIVPKPKGESNNYGTHFQNPSLGWMG